MIALAKDHEDRRNAAQIYRNAVQYHRNQIRFYCFLARQTPEVRGHMMMCAFREAREIKNLLQTWNS